jgi:hypothetical protein
MKISGIKSRVLQSVHESIYRHWVDPLQRRIPDLVTMKQGWRRTALLKCALWGVNVGRLAIIDFRAHVRRLRGPRWSVVYIGAGFSFEELCHILLPELADVEELPHVFLWQIPALAKKFADQGELVVCELNTVIRWRPRGAYVFTVPRWVRQALDIARPMEDILAAMNQNMRRSLRRMQKQGFDYVFTQDGEDFDLFYRKMYCPYISQRHGARAALSEYDDLRRQFERGGLILVRRDQELICGMLCRVVGDACEADQMGVHEGEFDQVREGANVALWWFMMDWARRNELRRFDFGASRAQTANGTFNFKRQWGTRVAPERDVHTEWVFYGEELLPGLRRHLNEQGFISRIDDLHYRTVLLGPGEELTGAELIRERQSAARCGLDGVLLISPGQAVRNRCTLVGSLRRIPVDLT